MADQTNTDQGNTQKDPEDWVTGDEAMTGAQRSYLETLSQEAGEVVDDLLTKGGRLEAHRRAAAADGPRGMTAG